MLTNAKRQIERTGKHGTPRKTHLQAIVTEFQSETISTETKERILCNLANFAYDPYNYTFLRELNVLELFLDHLTDPNPRLVEFSAAGICNAAADPLNATLILSSGGLDALLVCLRSPFLNVVKYALAGLFYLCESGADVTVTGLGGNDEIVEVVTRFAQGGGGEVGVEVRNLARVLLDKHLLERL